MVRAKPIKHEMARILVALIPTKWGMVSSEFIWSRLKSRISKGRVMATIKKKCEKNIKKRCLLSTDISKRIAGKNEDIDAQT